MKKVMNNKNKNIYFIINEDIINCTNSQDGQKMVLYSTIDFKMFFVREINEFNNKFTIL